MQTQENKKNKQQQQQLHTKIEEAGLNFFLSLCCVFFLYYIFFSLGDLHGEMRWEMRWDVGIFVLLSSSSSSSRLHLSTTTKLCGVKCTFFCFAILSFHFGFCANHPPPPTPPPLPLSRNSYNAWCVIIRKRQINKRHFRMILVE